MTTLGLFFEAAYAVRWILVFIGFIALGLLYAIALADRNAAEAENADLAAENDRLRARHPQIVALPPRQEGKR